MASLEEAIALRDQYEASLDEAQQLRERYHREVVKLHRSGMTLREIADGLGVSHQRIHQIVSPAEEAPRRRRKGIATAVLVVGLGSVVVLGALVATRPGQEPGVGAGTSATPHPAVEDRCEVEPLVGAQRPVWILTIGSGCRLRLAEVARVAEGDVIAIDARTGQIVSGLGGGAFHPELADWLAEQARVSVADA